MAKWVQKGLSKNRLANRPGRRSPRRQSFLQKVSKPVHLLLVLAFAFGSSAVARAAHRVKKMVKGTKDNLRSSFSSYLTSRAWGYFRPAWEPETAGHLLADSAATRIGLIDDPEHKIESDFQVPFRLRGRVAFWVSIYSQFGSYERVVHDRDNPEIIYGYIDFRPLYHNFPARIAEAKAHQIEKAILLELRGRIAEAVGIENNARTRLNFEQAETIRKFLGTLPGDSKDVGLLLRRVRTQSGQKDHFLKALQRSRKLMPEMEQIFQEKGLPLSLARLPFVESSFNPAARSKDGAVGMWQILPDTAKLFDRTANRRERAEPIRQSKSAAKFLNLLHKRLPNWGVAVTAYNSGAARLDRIVKKHGVNDIEQLVALPSSKDTLGFAGKNFFCELLAANLVEAYQTRIFPPSLIDASKLMVSRRMQSLLEAISFSNRQPNSFTEKTKTYIVAEKRSTASKKVFNNRAVKRRSKLRPVRSKTKPAVNKRRSSYPLARRTARTGTRRA